MQHNKYVGRQYVKIYCEKKRFPEFQFIGPHNKPHVVSGLGKHYNMRFDTKLVHCGYMIRCLPCVCPPCTYIINQPWDLVIISNQQPCYQSVKYCTYWPVVG